MNLRLAINSLRQLTRRAWNWLWPSYALLRETGGLEARVQNPTPTTESLLVSEPSASDAEWLAELRRQLAVRLDGSPAPELPDPAAEALLGWRRQTCERFERGDWLSELGALVQPGTTLCASIREQGVFPRHHAVLIRSVLPAPHRTVEA